MYKCQECGRKFKTTKAAELASRNGCPGCGGVDVDLDVGRSEAVTYRQRPAFVEPNLHVLEVFDQSGTWISYASIKTHADMETACGFVERRTNFRIRCGTKIVYT